MGGRHRHLASNARYFERRESGERIYEHRAVMAERIGRALLAREVVHHVDEEKRNNEPSNLWLFPTQGAHVAWHALLRRGGELRSFMPPCLTAVGAELRDYDSQRPREASAAQDDEPWRATLFPTPARWHEAA